MEAKTAKVQEFHRSIIERERFMMQQSPRIDPKSAFLCTMKMRNRSVDRDEASLLKTDRGCSRNEGKLSNNKSFDLTGSKSIKKQKEDFLLMQREKEKEEIKAKNKAKSDTLVQSKINKELDQLCIQHNGDTNKLITFPTMCKICVFLFNLDTIMKSFGMIQKLDEKSSNSVQEQKLAAKLWEVLQGDTKEGITFTSLKIALFAVMNLPPSTLYGNSSKEF